MKILSLFDGISIAQQAFKELGFEDIARMNRVVTGKIYLLKI